MFREADDRYRHGQARECEGKRAQVTIAAAATSMMRMTRRVAVL